MSPARDTARAAREARRGPGSRGARERLLDAAAELFNRDGVRGAGIDAVIARAGVAKMSFYRHFPSKDDLVAAWLRRCSERWLEWLRDGLAQRAATPRARLLLLFDLLGEWMADPAFRGCPFLNTAGELTDLAHPARAEVTRHKEAVRALLTELCVAAGLAQPDERADELLLLAEGACASGHVRGAQAAQHARRAAERLLREG